MSLQPGVLRIARLTRGQQLRLFDPEPDWKQYIPPYKLGTRTLAAEAKAARRRPTDEQVLRRRCAAQARYDDSWGRNARDILASLRYHWDRPRTPVKAMTDAQRKAALTAELKRLHGRGGDDGDE
jgi:hypothetical protein